MNVVNTTSKEIHVDIPTMILDKSTKNKVI